MDSAVKIRIAKRPTEARASVARGARPVGRGDAPQRERNPWKLGVFILIVLLAFTSGILFMQLGPSKLQFSVTDALSGNPVSEAIVSVYASGNLVARCTTQQGGCSLSVSPGHYQGAIASSNYSPKQFTVDAQGAFNVYVLTVTPSFNTVVQPGSMAEPCNYLMFSDANSNYYTRNCQTGGIVLSGANASSVLQSTINLIQSSGTRAHVSATIALVGKFYLTAPIDLTNDKSILIEGLNAGATSNYSSVVFFQHNGIGFDLTGSIGMQFRDLEFKDAPGYATKVDILISRDSSGNSAGQHTFFNLEFYDNPTLAAIYNYGSEQNWYNLVWFQNTGQSIIITRFNAFGVVSPFRAMPTGAQSMNENYFFQSSFSRSQPSSGLPTVTLDGVKEVRFLQCFFYNPNIYAVNITTLYTSILVTFDQSHLESGGLLTSSNAPPSIIDISNLAVTNSYLGNANIPNGSSMVDLNYANLQVTQLVIQGDRFNPGSYLNFRAVTGFNILLDKNTPYLHFFTFCYGGVINMYDGSKLTMPPCTYTEIIFSKAGAANSNTGSVVFSSNTTYTKAHGLITTPTQVYASLNNMSCGQWQWTATTTAITFTVATSCSGTLYWYAIVYQTGSNG